MKKRMRAELDLRAAQCKALEIALVALEAAEEDHLENRVAAEEMVKSFREPPRKGFKRVDCPGERRKDAFG